MTIRQDVFAAMLGAERAQQEPVQADLRAMAEVLELGDDDPFWGVVALIYARLPRDGQDWEALREAVNRLDGAVQSLGALSGSGNDGLAAELAEAVKAAQSSGPIQIDTEGLARSLGPQLDELLRRRRRGLTEWLGEHARTVVIGGLASLVLVGVLVVAGTAGGYVAGQAAGEAKASEAARWVLSPDGQAMKRWATLNVASVPALMRCGWGGAAKRYNQDGRAACYPGGSGSGYYLP